MFGKNYVNQLINRSAESPADRRLFLKSAGAAGLGVVGMSVAGALTGPAASAATDAANKISDGAVLNFALNLEYLEAEFYSNAVHGHGIPRSLTHGKGRRGSVEGGREGQLRQQGIHQIAQEIARDELDHVAFLRAALGSAAVARPTINIRKSFTDAAIAAGLVSAGPDLRRLRQRGQLPARRLHLRRRRRHRLQGRRAADQQQNLPRRRGRHPGRRGLPRRDRPHPAV